MKPEKYYNENYNPKKKGNLKPSQWVFEFAEAYHKEELEKYSPKEWTKIEDVISEREKIGSDRQRDKDIIAMYRKKYIEVKKELEYLKLKNK